MKTAVDPALIGKYSKAIPRYTSFPTQVQLKPLGDDFSLEGLLRRAACAEQPFSLYAHLPYCPSLCYFCACNKLIDPIGNKRGPYLDLLGREVSILRKTSVSPIKVGQLHLGGGSPSYLSVDEMNTLLDMLDGAFSFLDPCDKSIELDPRSSTPEKIAVLTGRGFSRISMGVQDLDPDVQKLINRIQPFELLQEIVHSSRTCGANNIGFDLIYGLPGQSEHSFSETLNKVLSLRPDRIALFGYAHVPWKIKVQKVLDKYDLPPPELRLKIFSLAVQRFLEAGYTHIGLDHFVLPKDELAIAANEGRLRRNFMGYTTINGQGTIGIGVSSISDVGATLYQNATELPKYEKMLGNGELPVVSAFARDEEDVLRARYIEEILCNCEVNLTASQLSDRIIKAALPALRELESDGIVVVSDRAIRATQTGRFFLRQIASCFDQYLHTDGQVKARFSQPI